MNINVTRSSMPPYEEYINEIKSLWNTHWLTNMGEKHNMLENKLKELLGVNCVSLFTNGHLALENALAALDMKPGSEIITTPFTFVSTTNAIVRAGFVPVFCDINPVDFTIDTEQIEALISKKTAAILPVHVYGNICNVERIAEIAAKHDLKVIYDAAHAFGVKYKGVSAASFGDASMFSFHATKVFNTIEGGAVCCSDEKIQTKLNKLRDFGLSGKEDVEYIGGNAKMNEFQAAMGLCNLRYLDTEIAKRKTAVECYRQNLMGHEGLYICSPKKDVTENYSYFPVVFDGYKYTRDEISEKLSVNGIGARKYFFPLTKNFTCYKSIENGSTPVAEHISKRVLTLPLYADHSLEDVDRICKIILS